ncbi:uncharacterized protein JCM15063_002273 [Sporobolomyces koalae]|uniref:uncharacterized protein n=1 Tax=Sporobolomyces koalae TaxID=500713 RepID=UPI00317EB09E
MDASVSAISLPPPPPSAAIVIEQDQVVDERTGLLRRTQHVKVIKEKRKANSLWSVGFESSRFMIVVEMILPATLVFAVLMGASATVETEVLSQMACRRIAEIDPTLEPPASMASGMGTFLSLPGSPEADWIARCRASPAVSKDSTEIVTSIALVCGVLSALTSGYWGKLSDKYGRRAILAVSSGGELVTAAFYVLVLAFPNLFGYRALLLGACLGGLAGGQLTGMAVSCAYLGDCAVEGSKTQLLSGFFAVYMLGVGIGPVLGSILISEFAFGVILIYAAQVIARAIYLVTLPFMPESLLPSMRTSRPPSVIGTVEERTKPDPILVRLAKVPAELLKPFEVLLPRAIAADEVSTDKPKKDWRLTLIALSYSLAMIVPGMLPVKLLYARSKFGWTPKEIGRWITFLASIRVALLAGIVPFVVKFLRKPAPVPAQPRPEIDQDDLESVQEALKWDTEAAKLKKVADTVFDLSTARWSCFVTVLGYLYSTIPATTSRNFVIGSALTAPSSLVMPALQSLALAFASPDDAGKILACLSALATMTEAIIGPSLFGAIYVFSLERWAELVFVVAALWMVFSLVPLLLVKIKGHRIELEQ